jgi:hypothetical protein
LDSGFDLGWHYGSARKTIQPTDTFGVISFVDNKEVEIVSTVNRVKGVLNPLSIPLGCVMEVKEIGTR